jgi:hypothetical protein
MRRCREAPQGWLAERAINPTLPPATVLVIPKAFFVE